MARGGETIEVNFAPAFYKGQLVSLEGRTYRVVSIQDSTLTLKRVRIWIRALIVAAGIVTVLVVLKLTHFRGWL